MEQYDFTIDGLNAFYDAVCDEFTDKIHNIMEEINRTQELITDEQNTRFEKVYDSIAITITIGSHTITIPNNADNIEVIFKAMTECRERTI